MRFTITILILTVLLFENCNSVTHLNGRYANSYAGVSGQEIRFIQKSNRFDYFFRSEMGLLAYSTGSWERNKNQVILNGFTDSNIKTLNVESTITYNSDNNDKVLIRYTPPSNLVKADVIINDNNIIHVSMDTVFFSASKVKTIQVKSYLSYTGLLSSKPKIDTLYSQKININNDKIGNKNIFLNFSIYQQDFARIILNDTLTVKSNRIIYLGKSKLKK